MLKINLSVSSEEFRHPWKYPQAIEVCKKFNDQLIAEFASRTLTIQRNLIGPVRGPVCDHGVLIQTLDVTLPNDLVAFAQTCLPETFELITHVKTHCNGPAVCHARWIELFIDQMSVDTHSRDEVPLFNYPVACKTCGWLDYDAIPNSMKVNSHINSKQQQRLDVASTNNGMIVVRKHVLELLLDCTPDDFTYGQILKPRANTPDPDWHWVRPKHTLGNRHNLTAQPPFCPDCNRPANYHAGENASFSFSLIDHFHSPAKHMARISDAGIWFPSDIERKAVPLQHIAISGSLMRLLVNAGVKGIKWPDYIQVSLDPNDPMYVKDLDFEDQKANRKSKAINTVGFIGVTLGQIEHSPNEAPPQNMSQLDTYIPAIRTPLRDKLGDGIVEHMQGHLGPARRVFHDRLPYDELPIDVYATSPTETHPWQTLFTVGMSYVNISKPAKANCPEDFTKNLELMICLPPEWDLSKPDDSACYWPVFWLRHAAHRISTNFEPFYANYCTPSQYADSYAKQFDPSVPFYGWFSRKPLTLSPEAQRLRCASRTIQILGLTVIHEDELTYMTEGYFPTYAKFAKVLNSTSATEMIDVNRASLANQLK